MTQPTAAEIVMAFDDAIEGMLDMISYVDDYFSEKWGHEDYITRAKAFRARLADVPPAAPLEEVR